jgi:hypothetical protein
MGLAACTGIQPPRPGAPPVPASRPLVLLRESGSFNFTGFDGPDFVLYDDGLALYLRRSEFLTYPQYFAVALSQAERDSLLAILDTNLAGLASSYAPEPQGSDMARYEFRVWSPAGMKQVTAVGGLWQSAVWRTRFPPSLVNVYDLLTTFRHSNEQLWVPPAIEVLLWPPPRSNVGCEVPFTVPWPRRWPTSVQTKPDGQHFVRLDSQWLPVVAEIQHRLGGSICNPVRVGHRLWLIGYRYVFPAEDAWPR